VTVGHVTSGRCIDVSSTDGASRPKSNIVLGPAEKYWRTLQSIKEHQMQIKTLALRILPLALLLGAINQVCAQPNFSGEWKMNPAKSNFAPLPQPDRMVRKIVQHDSHLKIRLLSLASSARSSPTWHTPRMARSARMSSADRSSRQRAVGWRRAVIESKREVQGMEIVQRETLDPFPRMGRPSRIGNHVKTPQGAFDITIVLEKQ
jgi:hypothetical protein